MTIGLAHGITLLFVEGFLVCGFLAFFDYAPEANGKNKQNSFFAYLNGRENTLPAEYARKSCTKRNNNNYYY